MGQYYKAIVKERNKKTWMSFDAWTFNNGAKLMEHSYVKNPMVLYIKNMLLDYPMRVVWGGDYADNENGKDSNLYCLAKEQQVLTRNGMESLYEILKEKEANSVFRYLVNDSKKLFVDYSKIEPDEYGYRIDPLPLLCAEGNGQGGGDYFGTNMELVGTWARDFIWVTKDNPAEYGYKEIVPDFKETYE